MERSQRILAVLIAASAFALGSPKAAAMAVTVDGAPLAITASSALKTRSATYGAEKMINRNPRTAWCEGRREAGAGEWIEVDLTESSRTIELDEITLKIVPGYAKTDRLFTANARPARIAIEVLDRASGSAVTAQGRYEALLHDEPRVQILSVPVLQRVDVAELRLRITMVEVYPGTANENLCVTELRVFLNEADGSASKPGPAERQALIAAETDGLDGLVASARNRDWEAIQRLARLAGGAYIETDEGGEQLNEIYLDLMVAQPETFFFLLERQEEHIVERVVQELLHPASDKRGGNELLLAVNTARARGIDAPFFRQLIALYVTLRSRETAERQ